MALIDKSALVAEIEKLLNDEFQCSSYDEATGFQKALTLVKNFINSLEVKEVDLEKEKDSYVKIHKDIFTSVCQAILDGDDD